MIRVILDEGVPRRVGQYLPGYNVTTVPLHGWASVKNGRLLALIEEAGFDAFISNDKRLEFDQNMTRRPFAVLLLSTNHWETLKPQVASIATALSTAKAGQVTRVECGRFVPRPKWKPGVS